MSLELPKIEVPAESEELVRSRASSRLSLIGLSLLTLMTGVGARGVQLTVFPNDRTIKEASIKRWDEVEVEGRRGEIFDRNGRRLATSVATPNIVVDPFVVGDEERERLAADLAAILDLDRDEVLKKLNRRQSRYQRLARRVHPRVAAEVRGLRHRALWEERDGRRYYPEETLAGQLIGFVNARGRGVEGLERQLDHYLRGTVMMNQRRQDARGLAVDDPSRSRELTAGQDVHLTIDRGIQRIAERALEGVVERSEPEAATAIVVDVKTGDILAMAMAPFFNPNDLGGEAAIRKNHAVQDALEPGSVFKPFTAAAAVEEGLVMGNTKINCENGSFRIGRSRIGDDHPKGVITVSEVVKYSSNIGTAKLALQLGAERLTTYFKAFGFSQRSGIPLPGERRGVMRKPGKIKPIELATTSYGQGVTSTPIQLAMATAALANGGVRMEPRLVSRVQDVHGIPEFVHKPTVVQRVVSEKTAKEVMRMMVTVTEPGGTATRAGIKGYKVAGKTGTAEKVVDGRYSPSARVGSFMGFVPAEDPKLAIIVQVDEPHKGSRYGGIVAAPAFAEIGRDSLRLLGVPPDPALLEEELPAMAEVDEPEEPESNDTRMAWTDEGWTLPDLTGKGLRDVLVALGPAGVAVDLRGSGVVVGQQPLPGSSVLPGASVQLVLQ